MQAMRCDFSDAKVFRETHGFQELARRYSRSPRVFELRANPAARDLHAPCENMHHGLDFGRSPRRIYWETTRACGLACRHCRAEANPDRDPGELTTAEGFQLLEQIAEFGHPYPHLVLTGGDPLERPDLFELIRHARSLELPVAVAPSGTPRLTPDVICRFKAAGVEAISLSLDGSSAQRHDALRGTPGCFERTLLAARAAREVSLSFQVNTLVSAETLDDLSAIYELAVTLDADRFSLFFLVAVGRGNVLSPVSPAEAEALLEWLAALPARRPIVTSTEAPHLRRILLQQHSLATGAGIRDGNGILFISHTGEIAPSGFLEIHAGNVRSSQLSDVYRASPLFQALRRPEDFGGRCGACEFRSVCGGSRARAYAGSGDPLAEDPLCSYTPRSLKPPS